jgi:large subunit ribosomal protein L2
MPVRKFKPVTPGTRFRISNTFSEITKDTPEKSLLKPIHDVAGRNNQGRMTMRYRGAGHKKQYRVIDFKRDKDGIAATVHSIEYDPNRTAYIALLHYTDGEKRYILAPNGLKVGQQVSSGKEALPEVGNTMYLRDVPLGTSIHAIELHPHQGAALARSAGTYAELTGKEDRYAVIKMPSGEVRRILLQCRATIGSTSNPDHGLQILGKAGRSRWRGIRPRNRGVAMNPVDHPMGGGEGRASGGHPRSRTSIKAKGYKTRNNNKQSQKLIISHRNAKKNNA